MGIDQIKTPSSSEHTRLASLESDAALLAAIGTAVYSSRQKMLEQYGTIELNDKFLENSHNFHLSAPHRSRRVALRPNDLEDGVACVSTSTADCQGNTAITIRTRRWDIGHPLRRQFTILLRLCGGSTRLTL